MKHKFEVWMWRERNVVVDILDPSLEYILWLKDHEVHRSERD